MKRVLLFAATTGYQIRSFGEAARRLGVRLAFASDRCDQLDDPWWDGAIPVKFHDVEQSIARVTAMCGSDPPDGVLAVGDRPTVLAAHAAASLGLPGNPPGAAEASRNKLASRRLFAAAGLPAPRFQVLPMGDDPSVLPGIEYPAVVKPLALSGSRGVIRVDDVAGLRRALQRLQRVLRSPDVAIQRDPAHGYALVESFVPGKEYAIEAVLTGGVMQTLAIFDKPDPLDGPFFEETIYVTPSRLPTEAQGRLINSVEAAARALGLRHGPVHAECRVNEQAVYVLEAAARPIGGLCARALRFESPDVEGQATLEELLLRHAIGEPVDRYRLAGGASGVMMLPIPRRGMYRGVAGVEDARCVAGIDDVVITAKPDTRLEPLPEGRSYLGFIFAHGATPAGVEDALRSAHARLEFHIERELSMAEEP